MYYPDKTYTKAQYNTEKKELCLLFSLNKHYRRYKAKNYFFRLNEEYSLKYYSDENDLCLKMDIDNPLKQLRLILYNVDIEDVFDTWKCL